MKSSSYMIIYIGLITITSIQQYIISTQELRIMVRLAKFYNKHKDSKDFAKRLYYWIKENSRDKIK